MNKTGNVSEFSFSIQKSLKDTEQNMSQATSVSSWAGTVVLFLEVIGKLITGGNTHKGNALAYTEDKK